MIFVTVGTQDKTFERLFKEIERLCEAKIINEEVIAQTGCTKVNSKYIKAYSFFEKKEDYDKCLNDARVVITHGGVGSILGAIINNKKVIAVPRLSAYKEHTNDHQTQIVKRYDEDGYIIGVDNPEDIADALKKVDKFKPKKYVKDNSKMIKLIEEYIENN